MIRKTLLFLLFSVGIFVVGGIGGVFFERAVIPRLAASHFFSRFPWVRDVSENTTIINKTEQVTIREDDSVEQVVSQPATTVVDIIAVRKTVSLGVKGTVSNESKSTTGVLVTNDGVVATYRDAVYDGEAKYVVLLGNGQSYDATLLGMDPLTNLSFLRISGDNFPAIAFANSDDARVGKKLVAIGNSSSDYQNRFSIGILENKDKTFNLSGKTVASSEKWEGVFSVGLQSPNEYVGGPLVQWDGEMVGILGVTDFNNGRQYFVIPSNVVRDALNTAILNGFTLRPIFGAYYKTLTREYALAQGMSRNEGALIYSPSGKTGLAVLAGSPAEKAGLLAGDIVTRVNGQDITIDNPLSRAIGGLVKGSVAEITIFRGTEEKNLSAQL